MYLKIRAPRIEARKKGDHQQSPFELIMRGTLQNLGFEVKSSIAYRC